MDGISLILWQVCNVKLTGLSSSECLRRAEWVCYALLVACAIVRLFIHNKCTVWAVFARQFYVYPNLVFVLSGCG